METYIKIYFLIITLVMGYLAYYWDRKDPFNFLIKSTFSIFCFFGLVFAIQTIVPNVPDSFVFHILSRKVYLSFVLVYLLLFCLIRIKNASFFSFFFVSLILTFIAMFS